MNESKSTTTDPGAPAPGTPRTVAEALGQIVWVLSQSPMHREIKIKDLEWTFMPAILHVTSAAVSSLLARRRFAS